MYPWIVLLHVLSAFGFFLAHGASSTAMFKLPNERKPERICALLELCDMTNGWMGVTFLSLLGTGIAGGFLGRWWSQGWIWVSLGLLTAVYLIMSRLGRAYFDRIREAVGMKPTGRKAKDGLSNAPITPEGIQAAVLSGRPRFVAALGLGGVAVIVLLMMLKPF